VRLATSKRVSSFLEPLQYQPTINYRLPQGQYRQIIKLPQIEVCAFFNLSKEIKEVGIDSVKLPEVGNFEGTPVKDFVMSIIRIMEENYPKKFQPCPLKPDFFTNYNISAYVKYDFEKNLPSGDYKYVHRYWNDDDKNILTYTVHEKFTTNAKAFL
jgi:hypothetical protein